MKKSNRLIPAGMLIFIFFVAGCSMWARHNPEVNGKMNEGTMDEALGNMKKVMMLDMNGRKQYMMKKEAEALTLGKKLFFDTSLSENGRNCNSCHPNGATTGGEVEIPEKMGHGPYKLPIPTLIGASARFPKFKVPNNKVITLEMMDNNCIRMFMGGKRLPLDSPESYYLAKYVTSLSNGDVVKVGNK